VIATALCRDGLVVQDHFLNERQLQALHDCGQQRFARGEFVAARIGAGDRLQRRDAIRGDSTCWLEAPLMPAESLLLKEFEQLRLTLNREATLGLFDLELHYARYPGGAGYARHVDQPQGRTQRRVTVVLYLNPAWSPEQGGALRVFDGRGGHRDIEPQGGRLVCFLCAGFEHEVLPARCERWSVTGWFRSRD
jgi:SM-20-related protein